MRRISYQLSIFTIISVLLLTSCLIFADKAGAEDKEPAPKYPVVPIVMYHQVKNDNNGKNVISPYEFESDLNYLKDNHYTAITMNDLIGYVHGEKELPEKPVILSFDDGYLNNYVYVFPLLKKYDMKIVFSIVGKDTDDFTLQPNDDLDYSHVTWEQINEMIASGLVEVQNHSYSLHQITSERYGCRKNLGESLEHYEQVLTEDIGRLQSEMKMNTGFTPTTFAYPYGRVSPESVPIIKKLGFQASLTCDYGVNVIKREPDTLYGLKRICRSHEVSCRELIEEAMKTLKFRKID